MRAISFGTTAFAASPSSPCGSVPSGHQSVIADAADMLVDDICQIVGRVSYIEVAPRHLFTPSLTAELADAVDRLAAKVARLTENVS